MTIYQVRTATKVYDSYQNLYEAQLRLAEYAIDRRNKFGVRLLQMSEDRNSFSYLIGWEEVEVKFWIDTIEVK
jgi:hypothetical protein